jgi:hypothetical protein
MSNFHNQVVQNWLQGVIPKVVEKGGNHADVLGILENLVVGTLFVTKEVFGVGKITAWIMWGFVRLFGRSHIKPAKRSS